METFFTEILRLFILCSHKSTLGLGCWLLPFGIKCYSCIRNLFFSKEVVSCVYATSYVRSSKWKHFFFPRKGKKFSSYWARDDLWASVALVAQMLGRESGTAWNLILHDRQYVELAVEFVVTVLLFSLKIMTMRKFWPTRKCHCTISQQIGSVP